MTGKRLEVTITDPGRKAEWERVFGTATVPVRSDTLERASAAGREGLFYKLDLAALTAEQRARLVAHLSAKFGYRPEQVQADLDSHGVPILADDAIPSFTPLIPPVNDPAKGIDRRLLS